MIKVVRESIKEINNYYKSLEQSSFDEARSNVVVYLEKNLDNRNINKSELINKIHCPEYGVPHFLNVESINHIFKEILFINYKIERVSGFNYEYWRLEK